MCIRDSHWSDHSIKSQSGGECCGFPMAVRDCGTTALTSFCPATQACHLGGSAGFIDKDQLGRIKVKLPIEPGLAGQSHVFALLLTCMGCLFLCVRLRLLKKCQTVAGQVERPCSSKSHSAISWSAISGLSSTRSRMKR